MLTTLLRYGATASLIAFAASASAVNLSSNGMGQALVYPYYTVNAGQQTLLTIVNVGNSGKAVKVRFLEGYNGRDVLEFIVFLSAHDVWTANVFKLSDAGIAGSGAAIFTTDKSCMAPQLPQGPLATGARYQQFLHYDYSDGNRDTGPTGDERTNEGHLEAIAMADIVPGSAFDHDIAHASSVPPGCAHVQSDLESGDGTVAPTSGLFGSASIVDVADGTFYAYNAVALDGFTATRFLEAQGSGKPDLASVNDPCCTSHVTAHQIIDGRVITSTFAAERAIDAVSAVFSADALYNEYVATSASGTDWVMTFPTKRYYVDSTYRSGSSVDPAPFETTFGGSDGPGVSCVEAIATVFDREENTAGVCGFDECPPQPLPPRSLCLETNVLRFGPTSVLGSQLTPQFSVLAYTEGMLQLDLGSGTTTHNLRASIEGNEFHGLPVTGFAVTKFVNGAVSLTSGGTALANYTAAYPHRATTNCSNTNGPCN